MTLIDSADTSALRSYTRRGLALLATGSIVAAVSLLAIPLNAQAATAAAPPASVVPSAVQSAAPVGKLVPSTNCVATAATERTCELFAMAGTTRMNGGTEIPIWGFSTTGATGSATAPGPQLVVNQGDKVTLTLHNQLPDLAGNVSLAFPGQPASAFSTGLSDKAEDLGVANNATSTYTFTANRPGTFIYEAGHTAHGARQVAMGLAGALVVLASDGSAYGPPATDYPSTATNDEAVVVLSEIDPAFNACPISCSADPQGFDMRSFAPKYRMINGKPYPGADPIGTDQNHTLLLRYVNVGSQTHAMSLLGNDQTQVAQDGHAMKYADTEVTAEILPGNTVDTIVTVPGGSEAKYALFEANGRLDNDGQTTAVGGQSLAFGGMLTFLDTNAPAPSSDGVGPVSSNVTVSPNPSNGVGNVTVTADLSDATTGGANVKQAEIVIDDPSIAVGFGTPMTLSSTDTVSTSATGTVKQTALNALVSGKHTVFVRGLDSHDNWGVVSSTILNLAKAGPQTTNGSVNPTPANGSQPVDISATGDNSSSGGNVTAAEYFVDTLGADGTGASLIVNRNAPIVSVDGSIPAATVAGLSEGAHIILVHSMDATGKWGAALPIPLLVDTTGPGVEAASVGPNPTNGILTDKSHPGYLVISARISDKDRGGAAQNAVIDAEAFVDPSTAVPATAGTGLQLAAVDGAMDSQLETVYGLIPISQVRSMTSGTHHVFIHGKDAAGNWGILSGIDLNVDKVAPVLQAVVGTPNPTNGAANLALTAPVSETTIGVAEFWLGATDPGIGKGTSVAFSFTGTGTSLKVVANVPLAGIVPGSYLFNLRVKDTAGNWSNAVRTAAITVTKPNPIFSNGFSSGDTSGWSASTGGTLTNGVTVTTGAGLPNNGTNFGLRATMPGGSANRASYVTDTTPTAEMSYHASFAFNANTLITNNNSAATVVNLFEARTAADTQVFAVQLRRSGGVNQIQTSMFGSTNPAQWVALSPGTHTIQVDWTAGAAGTLGFVLDGGPSTTRTGNTGNRTVGTALLGLTAGFSNNTSGTAFFDTFNSTRFTLP